MGIIERDVIYVDGYDEVVDISDGWAARSDSVIREMEFIIGNGVSIIGRMPANRNFFGTADRRITDEDEELLDAHPGLRRVLRISTNIEGVVRFDFDRIYYVYDHDGHFVGMSDRDHQISATFFLSTEQLLGSGAGSAGQSNNSDSDDDYYDGGTHFGEIIDDQPNPPQATQQPPLVQQMGNQNEWFPDPETTNQNWNTPANINDNPGTGR